MKLITLNADHESISTRFRKADAFLFVDGEEQRIVHNEYRTFKLKQFFEQFVNWGVTEVYLKELGYKTFLKLEALGVKVFFVDGIESYEEMNESSLVRISMENAKDFCSLGHYKK